MTQVSPQDAFRKWANQTCVRNPRCWGGVNCLHKSYLEWAVDNHGPLVTRATFEDLLLNAGHPIKEVMGARMVEGMTFRSDLEAALSK